MNGSHGVEVLRWQIRQNCFSGTLALIHELASVAQNAEALFREKADAARGMLSRLGKAGASVDAMVEFLSLR